LQAGHISPFPFKISFNLNPFAVPGVLRPTKLFSEVGLHEPYASRIKVSLDMEGSKATQTMPLV
jgi:hypothetical protein